MARTPSLLLETLRIAVPLELAKVSDASMDLFLVDRDRFQNCHRRADKLSGQVKEIYGRAESARSDRADLVLSAEDRAEVDRLNAEITELRAFADTKTTRGLIDTYVDNMLFGGRHAGETFTALAYSLAHLAQQPGGVTFAGLHWCRSGHVGTDHTAPCLGAENSAERAA
jgi:hypothetical protein